MSEPVLTIDKLTIRKRRSGNYLKTTDKVGSLLLSDISLTIRPGETFALVGPSGVGKTTLALAIMGLLPASISASGLINGRAVETTSARGRVNKAAGMIFQDADTSLNPAFTIGEQIADIVKVKLKRGRFFKGHVNARQAVSELLAKVGLDEPGAAKLYPFQLSSGMKQRVLIAMALAGGPKLLIADEPTSSLDTHLRKRILYLLKEYQAESDCGILLISHDLLAVKGFADKAAVINAAGLIVESGPAEAIFAQPSDEYTKQLLDSLLTLESAKAIRSGLKVDLISGKEDNIHA